MEVDKQAAVAEPEARSTNTAFSAALTRIHRKLKPWHIYTMLAAALLAIILAVVLTYIRDQQRKTTAVQVQVSACLPCFARIGKNGLLLFCFFFCFVSQES